MCSLSSRTLAWCDILSWYTSWPTRRTRVSCAHDCPICRDTVCGHDTLVDKLLMCMSVCRSLGSSKACLCSTLRSSPSVGTVPVSNHHLSDAFAESSLVQIDLARISDLNLISVSMFANINSCICDLHSAKLARRGSRRTVPFTVWRQWPNHACAAATKDGHLCQQFLQLDD